MNRRKRSADEVREQAELLTASRCLPTCKPMCVSCQHVCVSCQHMGVSCEHMGVSCQHMGVSCQHMYARVCILSAHVCMSVTLPANMTRTYTPKSFPPQRQVFSCRSWVFLSLFFFPFVTLAGTIY